MRAAHAHGPNVINVFYLTKEQSRILRDALEDSRAEIKNQMTNPQTSKTEKYTLEGCIFQIDLLLAHCEKLEEAGFL